MFGLIPYLALSGLHISHPQSLPPAMTFPQSFEATVVGRPALASTISQAVGRAINMNIKGAAGANWTYTLSDIATLRPGSTETITAYVNATAPNCTQAYGKVMVTVNCAKETFGDDQFIWFCNSPETLKGPGPLYANVLKPEVPVRVLYHHVCYNLEPLFMRMALINPSDTSAKVMIFSGDSEPSDNPALAGYQAARVYLPARSYGSGSVLTLAPHTKQIIALRKMVSGKAMSGLCSIQLLQGGPEQLQLRADCVPFVSTNRFVQRALITPDPWNYLPNEPITPADAVGLSDNQTAYIGPYDSTEVAVLAGGAASDTLIGVEGIPKVGGGRHLNGNFGVVYRYQIDLINSSTFRRKFKFSMRANSGYSSGVFLINGQVYGVRPQTKYSTRQFYEIVVPPSTTVKLKMETVPVSGCCYPASVWITSGNN